MTAPEAPIRRAEHRIGRYLIAFTYLTVGLLAVGVGLLFATGTSPLAGGPNLDLTTLAAQAVALDASAWLWLGLMAVIATPIGRVVLAAVAYAQERDRAMFAIALAILAAVGLGVVSAVAGTV